MIENIQIMFQFNNVYSAETLAPNLARQNYKMASLDIAVIKMCTSITQPFSNQYPSHILQAS
jgi:hypothetical protein